MQQNDKYQCDEKDFTEIITLLASDWIEKQIYKKILKLDKDEDTVDWGEDINIIIVCDNGYGRVMALYEFLTAKTDVASVGIVKNISEFNEYMNMKIIVSIPDIVIFAATQKNEENYKIYDILKKSNPRAFQAMYAFRDFHVENICQRNNILCIGDCEEKTARFLNNLITIYNLHRSGISDKKTEKG